MYINIHIYVPNSNNKNDISRIQNSLRYLRKVRLPIALT